MVAEPDLSGELRTIRTVLRAERVHYRFTLLSPATAREDFTYLFSGHRTLYAAPLFWRLRRVQANMTASDSQGRELITLPSKRNYRYVQEYVHQEAELLIDSAPASDREAARALLDQLGCLANFERTPAEQEQLRTSLTQLRERLGSLPAYGRFRAVAERLVRYYPPFVQLRSADADAEYIVIHQGVDVNVQETPIGRLLPRPGDPPGLSISQWLSYVLWGSVAIEVPVPVAAVVDPPWFETGSLHVEVRLAEGLRVRGRPRLRPAEIFEGTGVSRNTHSASNYTYSYVSQEDARLVQRRIGDVGVSLGEATGRRAKIESALAAASRGSQKQEDQPGKAAHGEEVSLRQYVRAWAHELRVRFIFASARVPRVRILASVENGLRLLALLLWTVVGLAYALALMGMLTVPDYIELFAALLVVTLTVAIYAMDKPFLRPAVSGQVAITTALFFELPLLVRFFG